MSEVEDHNPANLASHTLAFLRRIDRRQNDVVDLLSRQQDLISRLERDMRDGFEVLSHRFDHVARDLGEIKSDIMLLGNKLLNRLSAELDLSRRLERIEERMAVERDDIPSPSTI